MKNIFSLKKSVTALSLLMACGVSAQNATFEKFMTSNADDPTLPFTHRTRPVAGDYNNDDYLDIILGGQSFKDYNPDGKFDTGGWYCAAIVVKNNGDGTFTVSTKSKSEAGTDENPDTPGYPTDALANLPVSTFSFYRFLDFNNDGNLDLIIRGKGEHNFNVGEYLILLENQGPDHDYKFKLVENHGINQAVNEGYLEGISVGDYNKDGFVDVVVTGCENAANSNNPDDENYDPERPKRRFVELYKNNGGDGTFSLQKIVTVSKDGDWEGNFKPMSHSDVSFADLDNDGWLDIIYTGYSDNEEGMPRESGKDIRIYQNVDDGTAFLDVTPLEDPAFMGGSEVTLFVEDLNGDGLLDFILMGDGAPSPNGTTVYLNNGDFSFSILDNTTSGFMTVRQGTSGTYADLNHDGKLDAAVMGWSTAEGGLFGGIIYQGDDNKFTYENALFLTGEAKKSGGLVLADLFNHGKLDAFQVESEWKGEVALFKNTSSYVNQAPSVPTNVAAAIKDGILTVSWGDATDDVTPTEALFYNVYVKNNNTGKIFMIIPANPETGRLKVTTDYQNGVRSTVKEYSMTVDVPEGYSYTVGVQAIDQAQSGSLFATVSLGKTTGIEDNAIANVKIESVKEGFIVKSAIDQNVAIIDMLGRVVKKGMTNELISVPSNGIYLIATGGKTYKVGK